MSISPYGLNYGYRGGVSSFYRPTNSIGSFGIGINQYSSGFGRPYGSYGYGSSYNYGSPYGPYYGANYPPQYNQPSIGLSAAEQAARTTQPRTIINDAGGGQQIVNDFYPKVSTTASGRDIQRRSEMAFKTGDYRNAESLASQAMVIEPRNGQLMLFASQASFANGNFSQAASYLNKATQELPSDQWSFIVKNYKGFYGRNDYVTQTNRLTQHLASNPTDANAFALRGYHYGSLGYVDAATNDFQSALAADPNHDLSKRLLPVLGTIPLPASEEVEAPITFKKFTVLHPINNLTLWTNH